VVLYRDHKIVEEVLHLYNHARNDGEELVLVELSGFVDAATVYEEMKNRRL
jgi:hypothetical protein